MKRKTPTQHSYSHMSGQTAVIQGLQIANAPSPCRAGLDPGQLEKGQDQSPVMEILTPLAPTGTRFQPCIPSSLSLDPTPMDPTSLLSLTHFGSSQPLLEPLHTKYLRDGACVCVHLCICVSMNPMNILLLQSPRPPGFSQNPVLPLE